MTARLKIIFGALARRVIPGERSGRRRLLPLDFPILGSAEDGKRQKQQNSNKL